MAQEDDTPFIACCWSERQTIKCEVWCCTVTVHWFFSFLTGGTFLQKLTLRVKDKFSTHDLASEVTGLHVTTESSNLAISSVDRPGLSPNLKGLSGQSFLFIYSLSRWWQVQVKSRPAHCRNKFFSFAQTTAFSSFFFVSVAWTHTMTKQADISALWPTVTIVCHWCKMSPEIGCGKAWMEKHLHFLFCSSAFVYVSVPTSQGHLFKMNRLEIQAVELLV